MPISQIEGSFRDPSGHVFDNKGRIFRSVTSVGAANYEATRDVLRDLAAEGQVVEFREVEPSQHRIDGARYVLEHPHLDCISYPYEWSFSLLKRAALFHLDLQLILLERGLALSDATAFNVQFNGPHPIFIDHLSFRPYMEGEFWLGHRQFCEQFLNPLLLRAELDVPHNAWYRGNLEGIPTEHMARLLPWRNRLSWRALANVILPAGFQRSATSDAAPKFNSEGKSLPKVAFAGMLRQLRNWIADLKPRNVDRTVWASYASTTTYDNDETKTKRAFVESFIRTEKPRSVIDLGCNTGDYSELSLAAGAERVTGFDFDQQALDTAYSRALEKKLNFLPLFLDASNPSSAQGWRERERSGFSRRMRADAILALAFEHHLSIAKNVPLQQVVDWIVEMAPAGVIEFVPKNDPTVQKMLLLREDIFSQYNLQTFEAALTSVASITGRAVVSQSGRTLFSYRRHNSSAD
jgi:ribosomal protein L11 methylase PrmA